MNPGLFVWVWREYLSRLAAAQIFSRRILATAVQILSQDHVGFALEEVTSEVFPTAAARVQTRVWSCGILCRTKVALGQVFSENFGFPCQSTFHLLLHNHLHYHPRLAQ
jgi:hypothetical protein